MGDKADEGMDWFNLEAGLMNGMMDRNEEIT